MIFLFSYRYRLMISSFYDVCRRRYLPVQHQKLVIMQAVRKGSCYRQFLDCLFYAVYLVSVVFRVSLVLLGRCLGRFLFVCGGFCDVPFLHPGKDPPFLFFLSALYVAA